MGGQLRPILVIKVGTTSLLGDDERPQRAVFGAIAEDIRTLARSWRIVVVSSGAIGFGVRHMQLDARPSRVDELQALATIGQVGLLRAWREALEPIMVGQILLTRRELQQDWTRQQFAETAEVLIQRYGVVPVINENDAIADEEITFGDNDCLAAEVAHALGADKLVFLTNQPGILRDFGTAQQSRLRQATLAEARMVLHPSRSDAGTGGMESKLLAVEQALAHSIECYISDARTPSPISAAMSGAVGTKIVQ